MKVFFISLKRQSNEILDFQYFYHLILLYKQLTKELNYYRFWLRFSRVIQIYVLKNWLPACFDTTDSKKIQLDYF